jgi:hypothetical protein
MYNRRTIFIRKRMSKMNKMAMSLLIMLAMSVSALWASSSITNLKSGISISIQGQDEKDYVFERFYHDSLIDDHGVFYIRDTVRIAMAHNARNEAKVASSNTVYAPIGVNGQDGTANSGDEGVIRYKVDRDMQWGNEWWPSTASNVRINPAYTTPFSFKTLTYETGVPVVGTTGPKPGAAVSDRNNYYYRGMVDSYNDEWHIITVGDDDSWMGGSYTNHWGSDGKVHYFIVNPKTPAIYFIKKTTASQFYTTPPKSYFVPKIFDQATYVTDDIEMHLVNIMTQNPVYYRFDSGSFTQYTGPILSNSLTNGKHTLEYYYNNNFHRTRTITKNPGYPSDNDRFTDPIATPSVHGYLLWKNDAEFNAIKQRVLSTDASRALYKKWYTAYKTDMSGWGNGQNLVATHFGKGERTPGNNALANAFVAVVEGIPNAQTFALTAKRMLLENNGNLDLVGRELNHDFEIGRAHV